MHCSFMTQYNIEGHEALFNPMVVKSLDLSSSIKWRIHIILIMLHMPVGQGHRYQVSLRKLCVKFANVINCYTEAPN